VAAQIAIDLAPDLGQRGGEGGDVAELVAVARAAVGGVVAVLLAAARIAPDRLDVIVGARRDPDVLPCGRMPMCLMRASVSLSRRRLPPVSKYANPSRSRRRENPSAKFST